MAGPHDKHFSWLVPTFAITTIALFVLTMYLNDCPSKSSDCVGSHTIGRFAFQNTRENPLLGPSASTLQRLGALAVKKVVVQHQIWRMFTCMWLHAGLVHLLVNMISLLFVGIRLEQEFGIVRIGLLYIISGFGSLLSSLFIRTSVSVGASGALFGLLGAMLSELLTNWSTYSNKCSALISLILIITLNLAMGILPQVDNFAHIGGFVTGFLLGFVLLIRPQYAWLRQKYSTPGYFDTKSKSKFKCYQYVLLVISLVILIVGFAVGFVFLLGGVDGNEHCPWCHYLKCVPTSLWSCDPQKQAYCESTLTGDQLKLKCLGNGKTNIYTLQGNNSTSHLQELCTQLCR